MNAYREFPENGPRLHHQSEGWIVSNRQKKSLRAWFTYSRPEQRSLLVLGLLLATGGCSRPADPAQAERSAQPLSDRFQGLTAPAVKLDVGEDCTEYAGNEACESDLCLRVEPGDPETGLKPRGFCSIACDPDAADPECPDGPQAWRCTQVWPSTKGWFCAPPKTWSHGKATRHGTKVSGSKHQGGGHP